MREYFTRSEGLLDTDIIRAFPVSIYGLGATGSWLSIILNKMGFRIEGYDFGYVDQENIGPQLFSPESIGISKAMSLAGSDYLIGEHGKDYQFHSAKITRASKIDHTPIHVLAVDSMRSRLAIMKSQVKVGDFFVDSRMGPETSSIIYGQWLGEIDEYEKHWFPDSEGEQPACTAKATTWNSAFISSLIARQIYCFVKSGGDIVPVTRVDIPFSPQSPLMVGVST